MSKIWLDPPETHPPPDLQAIFPGHPLIVQTLARRGFSDPDRARAFLDPACYKPTQPTELPGIISAANRIETAIQLGQKILVWGDFDVDGQTSTTLLVETLRNFDARVIYHIPVRATEGHGITLDVLKNYIQPDSVRSNPAILLTCDTGISEHQAIDYARACGVDVIITDHHELPTSIPEAFAVINPHFLPREHPLNSLPGVGVAFKLAEALHIRAGQPFGADRFLDLVALGIVADVAELSGETRYLLQRGLQALQNTDRLGLQVLYEMAEIIPEQLDENQIGFSIGPRLNALGRLSDANPIVEFLTTDDLSKVQVLAQQLEGLNHRRRLLTNQVFHGALAQIERDPSLIQYASIVLSHPGWPNGILGIVASRLVERYGKPTVLLSIDEVGQARGSARSAGNIHITQAIASQADLGIHFGGHGGAAGLSLPAHSIPEFRTRLSRTIRMTTSSEILFPGLQIDAYINLPQLSLDFLEDIEHLAPFGNGNPPLIIATRDLKLVSQTSIGREEEHLRLVVEDDTGNVKDVIWWRGSGESSPEEGVYFDLAYRVKSHSYRGEQQLQIEWVDFRLHEDQFELEGKNKPTIQIIDHRNVSAPLQVINNIRKAEDIQVWAEAIDKETLKCRDRFQLTPGKILVIWTTPPDLWQFKAAIEKVRPETVYIFAIHPNLDSLKPFLTRLLGLVKHVIKEKKGSVSIEQLTAAMAHTIDTIEMGLAWLNAKGYIHINPGKDNNLQLSVGNGKEMSEIEEITNELLEMLIETAAFRKYFQRVKIVALRKLVG